MFAGCRCPRCVDSVLVVRTLEDRKVLACKTCAGVFVSAELGLRLLAVLEPDVPPVRDGLPSPACPVCRQGMRRVVAGPIEVEACKTHGVWFDAGDLPKLVRAAAKALGKEVPSALDAIEQPPEPGPGESAPPATTPSRPQTPGRSRPVPQRTAAHDAAEIADIVAFSPLEAAAEVALFPFRATLLTLELACGVVDIFD